MLKFCLPIALLFVKLLSFDCVAQQYNKNTSFKAGEKLSYDVFFNLGFINIKLADVVLWIEQETYNNKDVLIYKNISKTVKKYKWVIEVDDYYASYVEKSTMKVLKHVQKTIVDNYHTNHDYQFDHIKKKLYITIENSKTKRYCDTLNLKPYLHDLLSAVYYSRNIKYDKLRINQKVQLPVLLDTAFHNIYYRYLGKETIEIRKEKKINCVKLKPLLVETSIFKSGEKMTAWLSDDNNKLPILMESELWIGRISVRITEFEGLRHSVQY